MNHPVDYCLIDRPWLPMRRRSGVVEWLRPAGITSRFEEDPVVAFAWPRPDFDAAAREMMLGLLATACPAQTGHRPWREWWRAPPCPDQLDERLAPLRPCFLLDGPGPRFLQDHDERLAGEAVPAAGLLIDSPGGNTVKKNIDLFVKRARVARLGRAAAAMALFTLSSMSPSGGAGHRTSLRGGGPMSTLLLPPIPEADGFVPLWHQLWPNVVWDEGWPDPLAAPERVFPWLAATRASDQGRKTTPEDVHPAQCYWGMPRRIRLDFVPSDPGAGCDLTGEPDGVMVTAYRTRPHGNDYKGWSRAHPLSPYYRTKPTEVEWLPVHPQPGRLGYRDWVGLVVGDGDAGKVTRVPARAVTAATERLAELGSGRGRAARLLASGYDMDNMKARGFVESQMPVLLVAAASREEFEAMSRRLVLAARAAEGLLSQAVRQALDDGMASDAGDRRLARDRFWETTEQGFHAAVDRFGRDLEPEADDVALDQLRNLTREAWRDALRDAACRIFDQLAPVDALDVARAEQVVKARYHLVGGFKGYGKGGEALFASLGLASPPRAKRSRQLGRAA